MMLKKLKTVLPSLKPRVPFVLRSRVVYKIKCPHCEVSYVGNGWLLDRIKRAHGVGDKDGMDGQSHCH